MSGNIRSERGDLHDRRIGQTGDDYRAMLGKGLSREQAVALLAAKAGVTRPSIYKRLRSIGILPPYGTRRQMEYAPPPPNLPGDEIIARRVERDPCPRCGTRGDIPCGHGRASHLSNLVFA